MRKNCKQGRVAYSRVKRSTQKPATSEDDLEEKFDKEETKGLEEKKKLKLKRRIMMWLKRIMKKNH